MQNKLSKAIINIKTKRIMRIFVSKLRRNMTTLEPCDFTDLDEEKNRDRIEGFHINKHFYNFIIFIALIVLILAMVLSSFEAFIESYRQ